ncbi:MAG: sulfotransferase [Cryomorphaceae bacterium]|nr:sulfotransferase [Flavobacteriales bacterium]
MNGLFIVGNKRSGSTHIMRLLNLHQEVFISNESDIIWILYNFHRGREIERYPHDSPGGMNASLKLAKDVLDPDATVRENFENFQRKLMETGFLKMEPAHKEKLAYIGDQKPYQNIDPEMLPFILEHFPDAKFLHILRHPFEVIPSSMKFGGGTGGFIWNGMNAEEIMEKWEMHENWVAQAKQNYDLQMVQLKYGDLMRNPRREMKRVFDFLQLKSDSALLEKCRDITLTNFKPVENYKLTESQRDMLERYGMKTHFSLLERKVIPGAKQVFEKVKRKL